MNRLTAILAIALIGTFYFSIYLLDSLDAKSSTLKAMVVSKQNAERGLEVIQLQNNQLAYQNEVLQLETKAIKQVFPTIQNEINELRVKLSRVKSYSNHSLQLDVPLFIPFQDSLLSDSTRIKQFHYQDPHFRIQGIERKDSIECQIQYLDTLQQVVFRGERTKPWLWIFSKRKLMQRISLKSPYAKISYSQHLEIKP